MKNKVKIGILGCADVADRYAIKAFQSIDNAEVVSIASRNYAKAKKWALRFGIRAESSYDSLLSNKDIDAVYIPLPIGLHKKWALKSAAAGKHVICEKSLAENLRSVREVVNSCRSKGVVLYENFMCDFHPQHEKVLSLIRGGDIGKSFMFRSYFGFPPFKKNNIRYDKKLGGSSLTDAGAYTVFMARKLFGKEPLSVTCDLFYNKKNDVDIQGSAMLEFSDKQVALVAFSYCSVYQNNYSLWGGQGLINVGRAYSISPDASPSLQLVKNDRFKDHITNINIPASNQFEMIFRDFCDTVLHKKDRTKKINNIYSRIIAQARVLEALRISSKENRKVKLKEV